MKFLGVLFGIALVVGIVMAGSFYWDSFVIAPNDDAPAVVIDIEDGMGVSQIADLLEDRGVVTSDLFFKVYVKLFADPNGLQAGSYELKEGMNVRSVVVAMRRGLASEVEITIPEGFTRAQIGSRVVEAFEQVGENAWDEVTGPQGKLVLGVRDVLAGIPSGQGLEGYLFPDTYRFQENADAATVAETMVLTLKRRVSEQGIVIPDTLVFENGMTLHQVLTLASIVEREVRSAEDMKKVAGIFLTRLKIGMALQADSTVNYVTGKDNPSISLSDSKIDSPYNTYQRLGLPPGPISNPGMNAILAVLYPIDSDALYFLTADDGHVIYSRSFDEHVANKYKYLK